MTLDADTVRAALLPSFDVVLASAGIKPRRAGAWWRSTRCPTTEHGSDAFAVRSADGLWKCHACGESGDLLTLIALANGLDVDVDFPRVLEVAAQIAGVDAARGADPEIARRLAERRRELAAIAARDEAERAKLVAAMPARWAELARAHELGESYLAGRRLDPKGRLRDVVRYTPRGEPALPLHDLETGAIVGIQRRRVDGGEPKAPMVRGSRASGSALSGCVAELKRGGADVAVLVEGLADTLAAHVAFPSCAIFGAPGADHLPRIAAALASRLAAIRGWLLIVPHVDAGVGEEHAADAVIAAERAGLELDRSIHLVDIRPDKDLADAVARGFRWEWRS